MNKLFAIVAAACLIVAGTSAHAGCMEYMTTGAKKVPEHLARAYCSEQAAPQKKPIEKHANAYSGFLSCMSYMTTGAKKVAPHLARTYCKQAHYR